ncbi:MAG: nicotinate (nicotinamide) nucleotide adenylyltransferase [Deltaproteobacteria bacterium]|nr:nicotinate (nicotinamide) nucleotide adenylyltransferase [Deltaproteobacteria bacterium]MCB9788318.1 nicotinate (nicotinamide) nucleotide adenylyltransferase [Deltaproteobacteria bacterium]
MSGDAAPRRVALYGGSFDPPHTAHVLAATWALCRAGVDALYVIPTFRHPFGKELAPFSARVEMLRLAMAHLGPTVHIDTIESERAEPSYTVDTVQALQRREPDTRFVWLLGTDAWAGRERWHDFERLERLVDFVLIGRDGQPDPPGLPVPVHLPAIASSEIRSRLRAGLPTAHLLPAGVAAWLADHGLYR